MMKLKEDKTKLKYQVVQQRLTTLVSGLEPGDKIPSERTLAENLGCSFLTVRKAMSSLVDDGMIVRRPGSGSFVAEGLENDPEVLRIGLLISPSSGSYALRVIEELGCEADYHQYRLSSRIINNFPQGAIAETEHLKAEGCRAVIIPWFPPELTSDVAAYVHKSPLPVCLPQYIPGLQDNFFENPKLFGINLIKGMENICRYYYEQGYRRIAYLGPNTPASDLLQKNLSGYNNFLCEYGLESYCALVSDDAAAMDQQARNWKKFRTEIAIVSYDDDHAFRMITSMHKIGLSAPDDFAITGYGNGKMCNLSDPPLSSVYQDFSYVASWMLRNAKALCEGKQNQSQNLPRLRLAVRRSCGGSRCWSERELTEKLLGCGFTPEIL